MQSLSALRTRHILFDWTHITFSNRLVKFQLEYGFFTSHADATLFLKALSSAHALQDLSLISVVVLQGAEAPFLPGVNISLPNLRHLHPEDLHFSDITLFLSAIAPGSHSLTLVLTRHLQYIRRSHWETDQVGIKEICDFLLQFPVHKLVLGTFEWDDAQSWAEKNLSTVLGSMPTLKTLVLDSYTLNHHILQALVEPRRTHSGNQVGKVSNLKNIEFFRAKVPNGGAGLRSLVESRVHSIKRLVLGGTIEHDPSAWSSIQESDGVVGWLKKNIHSICLVRADRSAPDTTRTLLELQLELWDE